jgi:hypothetical protein
MIGFANNSVAGLWTKWTTCHLSTSLSGTASLAIKSDRLRHIQLIRSLTRHQVDVTMAVAPVVKSSRGRFSKFRTLEVRAYVAS